MIKIWNSNQLDLLEQKNQSLSDDKIPEEVIATVRNTLSILDDAYGRNRDPEKDLGGFVCIYEKEIISKCKEYRSLLDKYGTSVEMAEVIQPIIVKENSRENQRYCWYYQLFILSSDYTLTIVYKDII